ncbi:MAG: hypothetical protein C5B50_00605 [Verrucomicrobia bacterium]|nr:MAG: hypothetical protein C5B50_00605 [Verrucomicrobiota bacterium]
MKIFENCKSGIRLASALFLGTALLSQAQNSPVGSWDCTLSGPREGLAFITFTTNNALFNGTPAPGIFTFTNFQVILPKAVPGPSSDPRTTGDNGRVTTTNASSSSDALSRIFGAGAVGGTWTYDSQGHIIGSWVELSDVICTTNALALFTNMFTSPTYFAITNIVGSNNEYCVTQPIGIDTSEGFTNYIEQQICYTNSIGCTATTNAVSFTGKAATGKHINLVTYSGAGKVTYQGTPPVLLTDFSGSYYATRKASGQPWGIEFFTLTSTNGVDGPDPLNHFYFVQGAGPAYSYAGLGLLSVRNRLAVGALLNDDMTIRAIDGSVNNHKLTGTLKGVEQSTSDQPRITLSITHQ